MDKDNSVDFLKSEYEKCWDYIKFHYEQRDRSQRFYFTFVLASGGLVVALAQRDGDPIPLSYLLVLILPLLFVGVFTLGQLIQLRRTTTLYHKTIVMIRSQLIGKGMTPLWVSDKNPRFYSRGFNFFTVLIVMLVTAAISGLGVYVTLSDFSCLSVQWSVTLSLAVGVLVSLLQFVWYRTVLTKEDDKYDARELSTVGQPREGVG